MTRCSRVSRPRTTVTSTSRRIGSRTSPRMARCGWIVRSATAARVTCARAKMIRATHNATNGVLEGEGDHLTLLGQLVRRRLGPGLHVQRARRRHDRVPDPPGRSPHHRYERSGEPGAARPLSSRAPRLLERRQARRRERQALRGDRGLRRRCRRCHQPGEPVAGRDDPRGRAHRFRSSSATARSTSYFGTYDGTCPIYDLTNPERAGQARHVLGQRHARARPLDRSRHRVPQRVGSGLLRRRLHEPGAAGAARQLAEDADRARATRTGRPRSTAVTSRCTAKRTTTRSSISSMSIRVRRRSCSRSRPGRRARTSRSTT